jgi:NAD-reducing hydrogenase large subunit
MAANLQTETGTGTDNLRRVAIEQLSRVEGHGKVTLLLDENNRVQQARMHIVEFRGFERFVQGRPYWEVPVLVQRLCGICPVSHNLAASKAMDQIVGVRQVSPTAEKIRRLMHMGQFLQSHALHFFHLASPDLLFGFDADVAKRNLQGVAAANPETMRRGVRLRRYGQEVIRLTAGKRVHGTGSIPGGVNKNLSRAERFILQGEIDQIVDWSYEAVQLVKGLFEQNLSLYRRFGFFRSNYLSLVRHDGALEFYEGGLRAIDNNGQTIFDRVDTDRYWDYLFEEVRPWSYMKFPFIRSKGPEHGWYRVGPLARINNCGFIPTPLAEAERREFRTYIDENVRHAPLSYHWARMIEMLHAAESIRWLLNDDDLSGEELLRRGERRLRGVGVIEAPRGTLIHHYRINEDDQIVRANLIVSTTHNNQAMNEAVRLVADQYFDGREITEGLLNHIEVAIRAFDPCLSCATHAVGAMPLEVELLGADGTLIQRLRRD